jgi:hypothetical protein
LEDSLCAIGPAHKAIFEGNDVSAAKDYMKMLKQRKDGHEQFKKYLPPLPSVIREGLPSPLRLPAKEKFVRLLSSLNYCCLICPAKYCTRVRIAQSLRKSYEGNLLESSDCPYGHYVIGELTSLWKLGLQPIVEAAFVGHRFRDQVELEEWLMAPVTMWGRQVCNAFFLSYAFLIREEEDHRGLFNLSDKKLALWV